MNEAFRQAVIWHLGLHISVGGCHYPTPIGSIDAKRTHVASRDGFGRVQNHTCLIPPGSRHMANHRQLDISRSAAAQIGKCRTSWRDRARRISNLPEPISSGINHKSSRRQTEAAYAK